MTPKGSTASPQIDIVDINLEFAVVDLLIRDIELDLKRQIEARARQHNHSLAEEAKVLLRRGLIAPEDDRKLGTELYNLVQPEDRGDDLVFEIPGEVSKPPDFK
jgi:plasmid stability protein